MAEKLNVLVSISFALAAAQLNFHRTFCAKNIQASLVKLAWVGEVYDR